MKNFDPTTIDLMAQNAVLKDMLAGAIEGLIKAKVDAMRDKMTGQFNAKVVEEKIAMLTDVITGVLAQGDLEGLDIDALTNLVQNPAANGLDADLTGIITNLDAMQVQMLVGKLASTLNIELPADLAAIDIGALPVDLGDITDVVDGIVNTITGIVDNLGGLGGLGGVDTGAVTGLVDTATDVVGGLTGSLPVDLPL